MRDPDETLFQIELRTLGAIRALIAELPGAERRTAQAVLDDPQSVINGSVGQLADRAGTSGATVVRLARRLGFEGFSSLKIALAHEAGQASAFGHPPNESNTSRSILGQVVRDEIDGLRHVEQSIDQAIFNRAVGVLAAASNLVFIGAGTSNHLAQLVAYRFAALGIPTSAPADALTQHLAVDNLSSQGVLFAISHTGATDDTCLIAEHARKRGVTVVGLTSTPRSPLSDIADHSISTGYPISPHRLDNFASRADHVVTLAALHTAVAEQRQDSDANGMHAAQLVAQHQR